VGVPANATACEALSALDGFGATTAATLVDVLTLALATDEFLKGVAGSLATSLSVATTVAVEAECGSAFASAHKNASGSAAAAVLDDGSQDGDVLFAGFSVASRNNASAAANDTLLLQTNDLPDALILLQRQNALLRDTNVEAVQTTDTLTPSLTSAEANAAPQFHVSLALASLAESAVNNDLAITRGLDASSDLWFPWSASDSALDDLGPLDTATVLLEVFDRDDATDATAAGASHIAARLGTTAVASTAIFDDEASAVTFVEIADNGRDAVVALALVALSLSDLTTRDTAHVDDLSDRSPQAPATEDSVGTLVEYKLFSLDEASTSANILGAAAWDKLA